MLRHGKTGTQIHPDAHTQARHVKRHNRKKSTSALLECTPHMYTHPSKDRNPSLHSNISNLG